MNPSSPSRRVCLHGLDTLGQNRRQVVTRGAKKHFEEADQEKSKNILSSLLNRVVVVDLLVDLLRSDF